MAVGSRFLELAVSPLDDHLLDVDVEPLPGHVASFSGLLIEGADVSTREGPVLTRFETFSSWGKRVAMRQPADELLIALSRGMDGWMLGSTTDAVEIATFADTTGNRAIPRTPEAVEQLLEDMVDAGLVEHRSRQPNKNRWTEVYSAYGLTEGGWARALELEADPQEPPQAF